MTIALEILKSDNLQRLSLADYLAYNDGTDTKYELLDGVLKPMSLGTVKHSKIIRFLDRQFDQEIQRSHPEWIVWATLMAVQSPRGRRWDTSRIPDLLVMPVVQYESMTDGAVITLDQKSPILVVEVVSPSTKTEDYRSKWSEYSVLDIAEYWIVDPIDDCVTVCVLEEGSYTNYRYTNEDAIVSTVFPALKLTPAQVLM